MASSSTSKQEIAYNTLGNVNGHFGLVLIHGWGCQKSDYAAVTEYLMNNLGGKEISDFQTICPDLPGHGSTSKDICPTPSIRGFAEVLITLINEIGLRDVVLVGHSMGVRIVSEIWRLSKETPTGIRVRALMFIDGSDYRTRPTIAFDKADPRSTSLTPEEVSALKAKVFQAMFSARIPEAFRKATVAHVASRDKAYSETLRDSMIAYDREYISATMELLGREGEPRLVNLQSSDTGGVGGERRSMRKGEVSKWMQYLEETVPQITQFVIEQSAHFPHVDWPDIVAERIWELVSEVKESST